MIRFPYRGFCLRNLQENCLRNRLRGIVAICCRHVISMTSRIFLAPHHSTEELERRYKAADGGIERSHLQIIWLLSQGHAAKLVPSGFAPACHRAEDWGRAAPLMRGDEECRARIAVRPGRRSARTGRHMAIGASGAGAAGGASMSGLA